MYKGEIKQTIDIPSLIKKTKNTSFNNKKCFMSRWGLAIKKKQKMSNSDRTTKQFPEQFKRRTGRIIKNVNDAKQGCNLLGR